MARKRSSSGSGDGGKKNSTPTIRNRKARFLYHIEDEIEAGIVLKGAEVKSLREGKATLQDGFAKIHNGEIVLHGLHIQPYRNQNSFYDLDADRPRKLLMHKKQIAKLQEATSQKGYTIVPLKIFFTRGYAKVIVGLAKGKKLHDKREDLKQKDAKREMDRALGKRG